MKPKFYPLMTLSMLFAAQLCVTMTVYAQNCDSLKATCVTTGSRCIATGSITITPSGGSGTYNYQVQGPTTTTFTSSNVIDGLKSGTYTVTVKDIVYNCMLSLPNVIVSGSYSTPAFGLTETDVTCMNGSDGTISVSGMTNGLAPFTYTLVAPSPMGIGTSDSTGTFTGLIAGTYAVQLTDSCGDIQTRTISIQNYSWTIYSSSVTPSGCTAYNAELVLRDSKGNFDTTGTAFSGFQYGVVTATGDTTWFSTWSFSFDLGQSRSISLVAKDRCGAIQSVAWSNTVIPSLQANVNISSKTCTGFNVSVMGAQNLTNPTYCLVDGSGNAVAGQPCNSSGSFTNIPYGSYCINMTNSCYDTVITRCFSQVQSIPAITGAVAISNYGCTTVTATVTGQQNLTNPQYCLFDSFGNPVGSCNTNGIFTGVPYGSYTINVTDGCTGAVLPISFSTTKPVPSVAATVTITGNTCTSFNAAVTGASNLVSPQYCLVDSLGNPITCNSNGVFDNLPYGSYCINITDACGDTTIQRCIHHYAPPVSGGSISVSNKTCSGFSVTATGQANVFNGLYCLQDSAGNPVGTVPCNSTGVFTNVPYGSYCIKTTDGCSASTNTLCFTVTAPVESVGPVSISNLTCAGFTATQTGQENLSSPTYCLFDSLNNPVGACNGTGIFAVAAYGSYSIVTTDGCSDSVFTRSFTVAKPVPSVSPTVNFSNQTCTTFSAAIAGQTNLTNPQYQLKDSTGAVIDSNNTGVFDNIAYGSYCIDITDGCMDTTIVRCFTTISNTITMNLTAQPSCSYNSTDISIKVTSGFAPFTVGIYDTLNNLIADTTVSSSNIVIPGLPSLITAQRYKVIVNGGCGSPDTAYVAANPSKLTHTYNIVPKCPSSITPSGSGDLDVTAVTNLSAVNVTITQQNFNPVSISYSFNSGSHYQFTNLDAGTYVLTYTFSSCSSTINDTVVVPPYTFPTLDKSAAYQCNDNSFTISAATTGGMSPFTYQIIGSLPDSPTAITAPQINPLFVINNGTQYSLIRLRAVDACGNSALNDVDILPLQNTIVTASLNCIYQSTTLSVNTVPNATYSWYYKTSMSATDSTLVGTDTTYTIPALTAADTGVYVNRMSLNSDCLTQLSYIHLDGSCSQMSVLSLNVTLTGMPAADGTNFLSWTGIGDPSVRGFIIERSADANGVFIPIGTVSSDASQNGTQFSFEDASPLDGKNFYRLSIAHTGNISTYSNIVALSSAATDRISVYPNPASDHLTISIRDNKPGRFVLSLYMVTGQLVYQSQATGIQAGNLTYNRDATIKAGIYFLKVNNTDTGESTVFKITFN